MIEVLVPFLDTDEFFSKKQFSEVVTKIRKQRDRMLSQTELLSSIEVMLHNIDLMDPLRNR